MQSKHIRNKKRATNAGHRFQVFILQGTRIFLREKKQEKLMKFIVGCKKTALLREVQEDEN